MRHFIHTHLTLFKRSILRPRVFAIPAKALLLHLHPVRHRIARATGCRRSHVLNLEWKVRHRSQYRFGWVSIPSVHTCDVHFRSAGSWVAQPEHLACVEGLESIQSLLRILSGCDDLHFDTMLLRKLANALDS